MIEIIHPSRLSRQAFFKELIHYLSQHEKVILRDIKRAFPDVRVDKHLEDYIKAGLILREHKRYALNLPFLTTVEGLQLDQEVFVDKKSAIYADLQDLRFVTELKNTSNQVVLREETDFFRSQLTLSNYFYKLQKQYELTPEQERLYAILGDVNPDYALKYLTTFLLKYVSKEELMQKRKDIFVDSLVALGYIDQNAAGKYELKVEFDKENLIFYKR